MPNIHGYQGFRLIYESPRSSIYRARRQSDELPVVLKILREESSSPSEVLRYKQEHKIASLLDEVPGAIRCHGLETCRDTLMLVMEDMGGEPLSWWMGQRTFFLGEWLTLAIQLAKTLGQIHAAQVVHKNLCPANILFEPKSAQTRIIDFGLASLLVQESVSPGSLQALEGTLAYTSPEQTGRMNRAIDHRADYYALGATLYHLATGRAPFDAPEPLELIHSLLSRQPVPPHQLNPEISPVVSEILLKLLAKVPEDRYQRIQGLEDDLIQCQKRYQMTGRIEPFPIGATDSCARLLVSQRLYGRESELGVLGDALERVCAGGSELVLIGGRSGVGKTALVQELFNHLTLKDGYFVSGKFEQLQRERPYSAFILAFQQLMRQILAEPADRIAQWQVALSQALSGNGKIVSELIPELELITGPQPELDRLRPQEERNRFTLVFQKFLSVVARPDRPLLMFIDDLQWMDVASTQWIELALTSEDTRGLLVIGAYRDNEVDAAHPLVQAASRIEREGGRVGRLTLGPLASGHVLELTADTLGMPRKKIEPLASLLIQKTEGNPFFLTAYLKMLVAERLLSFHEEAGRWLWDLKEIQSRETADNVADLLTGKIRKLPSQTQIMLQRAACIGSRFDVNTISIVGERHPADVIITLHPAVLEGLLLPHGKWYRAAELRPSDAAAGQEADEYRFAHDRVQQAAYGLAPEADRARIHHRIGTLLQCDRRSKATRGERIFEIVDHLNRGRAVIDTQTLRDELAGLNLVAGRRAKASSAYAQAMHYLTVGRELIGQGGWARLYDLALALGEEGAEVAYLCGEHERADGALSEVLVQARTLVEKTKAYCVKILCHTARGNLPAAIQTALSYLDSYGLHLSARPSKLRLIYRLLRTKALVRSLGVERLGALPTLTEPSHLAAIEVMRGLSSASYYSAQELSALLTCEQVRLLVKHGNCSWSGSIFSSLGVVLCGGLHDYALGYRVGRLALSLPETHAAAYTRCRMYFVFNSFVRHWREHLKGTLEPLLEGMRLGTQYGDLEYSALCASFFCLYSFYLGKDLHVLEEELLEHAAFIRRLKQDVTLERVRICQQLVQCLQAQTEDPTRLDGQIFTAEQELALLTGYDDRSGIAYFLSCKIFLCCLFHQYDKAVELADQASPYLKYLSSIFQVTRAIFFDSLARLGQIPAASVAQRRKILRAVAANQRRMRQGVESAPMNHRHMFLLVEAELARLQGRPKLAARAYRAAVARARKNGYIHEEAFAAELTGRFYMERKQPRRARKFLQHARACYLRWGATAKVKHLEAAHPALLARRAAPEKTIARESSASQSFSLASTQSPFAALGQIHGVLRAAQGSAAATGLAGLLSAMLPVVIEIAGADRGFLVLRRGESLSVEAWIEPSDTSQVQLGPEPLEHFQSLATAIVRYVVRSGREVLGDGGSGPEEFKQEPYLCAHAPKSLLCVSIPGGRAPLGALYLENNQTPGVFSPARVELIGLIASQLSIGIENERRRGTLAASLERAEARARAGSALLCQSAEELRTPINAIINLPDIVMERISQSPVIRCSACLRLFELEEDEAGFEPGKRPCPACLAAGALGWYDLLRYDGDVAELVQIQNIIKESGQAALRLANDLLARGEQISRAGASAAPPAEPSVIAAKTGVGLDPADPARSASSS